MTIAWTHGAGYLERNQILLIRSLDLMAFHRNRLIIGAQVLLSYPFDVFMRAQHNHRLQCASSAIRQEGRLNKVGIKSGKCGMLFASTFHCRHSCQSSGGGKSLSPPVDGSWEGDHLWTAIFKSQSGYGMDVLYIRVTHENAVI